MSVQNLVQSFYSLYERYPKIGRAILIYLFVFSFPFSFFHFAIFEPWDYVGMDTPLFYHAASRLLQGESPYPTDILNGTPTAGRAWGNYIYPPLFAWLLAPTTLFSQLVSKRMYVYPCMVIYFLLLVPWKGKTSLYKIERWSLVALLCIWGPAIETVRFGQSNFVTLYLIFAALCLLEIRQPAGKALCTHPLSIFISTQGARGTCRQTKQWEILAGILLGIACMVKLTPFVLLPLFLVSGQWCLSGSLLAGSFLTALLTGPKIHYDYLVRVLPTMTDFTERPHFMSLNRGVVESIERLVHVGLLPETANSISGVLGMIVNGLVLVGSLWVVYKYRQSLSQVAVTLIGCYLAPLLGASWFHHYTLALLPVVYVWRWLLVDVPASPWGEFPHLDAAQRKITLLLVLSWANFFFWTPGRSVHNFLYGNFGISSELFVSTANFWAYLFVLYLLISSSLPGSTKPQFGWWRRNG